MQVEVEQEQPILVMFQSTSEICESLYIHFLKSSPISNPIYCVLNACLIHLLSIKVENDKIPPLITFAYLTVPYLKELIIQ